MNKFDTLFENFMDRHGYGGFLAGDYVRVKPGTSTKVVGTDEFKKALKNLERGEDRVRISKINTDGSVIVTRELAPGMPDGKTFNLTVADIIPVSTDETQTKIPSSWRHERKVNVAGNSADVYKK